MKNTLIKKVIERGIIDTRRFRYVYDSDKGNIKRIELWKLDTTFSLTDWIVVKNLKY